MQRVTLLGVPIDVVTREEAVGLLRNFLGDGRPTFAKAPVGRHVMTPNSEMLVAAARNPRFHALLQRTALNLPDSVGLLWMARYTGQKLPERVTGVDTILQLCAELTEEHPAFLLGGVEGVGRGAWEVLSAHNPRLRVVGVYAGSPREEDTVEILRRINDLKPHLLLVAFGAPCQDLWIDRYLSAMPSVRVAVGIGGTLDFLAGVQRRAPVLVQKLWFEWLWRLLCEPRRLRRIGNAVFVFPWLVVRYGRKNPSSLS